ncbi:MAG: vanadium-dependent haloperoxidase [Myxococcota bacterium]
MESTKDVCVPPERETSACSGDSEEICESTVSMSRRGWLKALGGAAGAGMLAPVMLTSRTAAAEEIGPLSEAARQSEALVRRVVAAGQQFNQPFPELPCNGDDDLYADRIGSFSKTLPHNQLGEVDTAAYSAFLDALESGENSDFEAIPGGGPGKLANPQAAYAFSLAGADSHKINMPAVHAFASARQASEAGEVYWQAVTRDINFADYDSDPLIYAAADDMTQFSDFTGPKVGGCVVPETLFRGPTPGDLNGPYISQFLYMDIPYGNKLIDQRARNPVVGDDYMTDTDSWLAVQRGILPAPVNVLAKKERYIRNNRDLGEYVHRDFSFQAYLNATLIALGFGGDALDPNPYTGLVRQAGFITFGAAGIIDLMSRAAVVGLRVAWFHKWLVHRKLRPEAFGGRLHNHLTGAASYPINNEILESSVLDEVFDRYGTYYLPQAFPEGSPTHPSYPAGHAVVAGACVTVIKAFFDEDFVIPAPVVPRKNGRSLKPFNGGPLTLGGELDKLARKISLGRNAAGVHWRADGVDGLDAGEAVAITLLQDYLRTVNESSGGLVLTRFNGETVSITQDAVTPV